MVQIRFLHLMSAELIVEKLIPNPESLSDTGQEESRYFYYSYLVGIPKMLC